MITYRLFLLLRPVATHLPRTLLAWLAFIGGTLGYVLAPKPRRAVLSNLAVVLPTASPAQRRRLAFRVFIHGAKGYVELLGMGRIKPGEIRHLYPLRGLHDVEEARLAGRGIIFVGPHVGPISAAGQLLADRGLQTTVVVEPLQPPQLYDLVASLRESFGLRMLTLGKSTAREILVALRRGDAVGIAADRDVAGSGEAFPFFDKETRMTTAPATLARRTGAIVLTCAAYRTGLWTGTAVIDGPVEIPHTHDVDADVREGTRRIIERLEGYIRARPEQWVVFTEVWPAQSEEIAEVAVER